jgi:hypothetical protein
LNGSGTSSIAVRPALIRIRAEPGPPLGAILAGAFLGVALAVGLLGLDRLPFTACVFKATTGWPCLSCGSTRAFGRLFALDFAGALAMNPLAAAGALGIFGWGLVDLALLPGGRAVSVAVSPGLARSLRVAAVLAAVANWAWLIAAGR